MPQFVKFSPEELRWQDAKGGNLDLVIVARFSRGEATYMCAVFKLGLYFFFDCGFDDIGSAVGGGDGNSGGGFGSFGGFNSSM